MLDEFSFVNLNNTVTRSLFHCTYDQHLFDDVYEIAEFPKEENADDDAAADVEDYYAEAEEEEPGLFSNWSSPAERNCSNVDKYPRFTSSRIFKFKSSSISIFASNTQNPSWDGCEKGLID